MWRTVGMPSKYSEQHTRHLPSRDNTDPIHATPTRTQETRPQLLRIGWECGRPSNTEGHAAWRISFNARAAQLEKIGQHSGKFSVVRSASRMPSNEYGESISHGCLSVLLAERKMFTRLQTRRTQNSPWCSPTSRTLPPKILRKCIAVPTHPRSHRTQNRSAER